MAQVLLALVTLLSPAVAAMALLRWAGTFASSSQAVVAAGVVYGTLLIIPVHLVGVLQLAGTGISAFLPSIAIASLIIASIAIVALWLCPSAQSRPVPQNHVAIAPTDGSVPCLSLIEGCARRLFRLAVGAVLVTWGLLALNAFTSFPAGWDGLAYHLPVAARWLQNGSLLMPTTADWRYALPGNAEIAMLLGLATDYQAAALIGSVIAAIIALASIHAAIPHVAQCPGGAGSVVLASIPMFQVQAFDCYVDVFGTGFLMAGFALFLTRLSAPSRLTQTLWYRLSLLLAGCSAGIAIGTKPTLWPFVALFGVVVIATSRQRWSAQPSLFLVDTGLLVVGMMMPSAFWFLRAWVQTGNPVFPLEVAFVGRVLLPGFPPSEITRHDYELEFVNNRWEWLVYPWEDRKRNILIYDSDCGLGAVFAAFVPLGLLVSAAKCGWGYGRKLTSLQAAWITFVVACVIWWFFLRRYPRFGLPLIAFSCVLSAPMLQRMLTRTPRLGGLVFALVVCVGGAISAFSPVHDILGRVRTGGWSRAEVYQYPRLLDELPVGSVILNRARSEKRNFQLLGKNLTNRVIPGTWAPDELTPEFVDDYQISVVVEMAPYRFHDLRALEGKILWEGEAGERTWRIWTPGSANR